MEVVSTSRLGQRFDDSDFGIVDSTFKLRNVDEFKEVKRTMEKAIEEGKNATVARSPGRQDDMSATFGGAAAEPSISFREPFWSVNLQRNEIVKFLEYSEEIIRHYERGIERTDCRCQISSPFFLYKCTTS